MNRTIQNIIYLAFFSSSFSTKSFANNTCNNYLNQSITKYVEGLKFDADGKTVPFLSPIPTNYKIPAELRATFETLIGTNIVSPTAISILNSFPHQETDFKYVTLESWNRFLRQEKVTSDEDINLNDVELLIENPALIRKGVSVDEIFSPHEEPNLQNDTYKANQNEIDNSQFVKIPYWFIIFYSAARLNAESEFPDSDINSNPELRIQKNKYFHKVLGTYIYLFNKMTKWLNSQGLMSKTFSLKNIDEIDLLPFSQPVKNMLKKVLQSGILFRLSHSDPMTDLVDLTDSWMESAKSLAVASFKTYDVFTEGQVLVISTAGPQLSNLWMNAAKKNNQTVNRGTIKALEDLILHEALHAFSFSKKRTDLIAKYVEQKFNSIASEEAYPAIEIQMLKSKPRLGPAEFRSSIVVSAIYLIAVEARSASDMDFLIYKIRSILMTIYGLSDLNIDDLQIKNLILSFKSKSITNENFLSIIRFLKQIEDQLSRKDIARARILAFFTFEISQTLEEFLAHKVNNNFLDAGLYDFYPWAVLLSREELAQNWPAFFDLPEEFKSYLD